MRVAQDPPLAGAGQGRAHVVGVEGIHQVAVPEQLGAEAPGHTDPPDDQPVEDQQPEAEAHVADLLGWRPGPGRHSARAGHAVAGGVVEPLAGQAVAQLGVVREDPDDVAHRRFPHAGRLVAGERSRCVVGPGRRSPLRRRRRACALRAAMTRADTRSSRTPIASSSSIERERRGVGRVGVLVDGVDRVAADRVDRRLAQAAERAQRRAQEPGRGGCGASPRPTRPAGRRGPAARGATRGCPPPSTRTRTATGGGGRRSSRCRSEGRIRSPGKPMRDDR